MNGRARPSLLLACQAGRHIARLCSALLLIACSALPSGPAAAADLVVRASEKFIISVLINGHPVRLRVDPETPGFVVVNPDVARRIRLRPSLLSVEAVIGPVRLDGETKVATIDLGDTRFERRVAWVTRNAAEDADGLISPAALPHDRVIFELGTASGAEISSQFQMSYTREYGLLLPIAVGERTIQFQFSTNKPQSMATAAAGAHLAQGHGGTWAGQAVEQLIEYGVHRPVRPMMLSRPFAVQGLALRRFLVRTADHPGAGSLPAASADPEEIVVTGPSRQKALHMLTIGLDHLSACSSMVYERRLARLTLRCSPGSAGN